MKFEKAVRRKAKLRLALSGPSGSGKTLSALLLAKGIGGRIAVIDTERDSASLYAESVNIGNGRKIDTPEFDSLNLSAPYSPERYIDAIKAAADAGYDVLIIDSITHEWSGVGGCLELVDDIAKARFRGNSWSAWNEVTPRHRAFVDAILQSPIHVIVTMRSKTETAQQENQNGKKTVVKLGMKAEQRDGFEYEMSAVLDLTHEGHFATATKDRTGLFMGQDPVVITDQTGVRLLAWLEYGAEEPKAGMKADDVDKHIKAIAESADIESLNTAANVALEAATDVKDREAYKRFMACAKDCKATLEQEKAA
jgi:hypothetical protein